jgi:hypothetical protein
MDSESGYFFFGTNSHFSAFRCFFSRTYVYYVTYNPSTKNKLLDLIALLNLADDKKKLNVNVVFFFYVTIIT